MMVKSTKRSSHGQYNKYKKRVWLKVENNTDDVEIEVEVFDLEILDCLYVTYDKNGKIIIKEAKKKPVVNLLV